MNVNRDAYCVVTQQLYERERDSSEQQRKPKSEKEPEGQSLVEELEDSKKLTLRCMRLFTRGMTELAVPLGTTSQHSPGTGRKESLSNSGKGSIEEAENEEWSEGDDDEYLRLEEEMTAGLLEGDDGDGVEKQLDFQQRLGTIDLKVKYVLSHVGCYSFFMPVTCTSAFLINCVFNSL